MLLIIYKIKIFNYSYLRGYLYFFKIDYFVTDYKNNLTIFNQKIYKEMSEESIKKNVITENEFDNNYIKEKNEESITKNNNKTEALKESPNKKKKYIYNE